MSSIDANLIEAFAPYMTPDLGDYLTVIGQMFDELDSYAGLEDEEEGWQALLDPTACPAGGLPYLAQYVGEALPAGLSVVKQREWITDNPNSHRGTPASIFQAAQRTLTGARTVSMVERSGSAPNPEDTLDVHTYTAETPDANAVLRDLRDVVPADIVLNYSMVAGQVWSAVKSANATWTIFKGKYTSWDMARADKTGETYYSRPLPIPS
jgi:hypothetical protein